MPNAASLLPFVEMTADAYALAEGCDALMVVTEWNEFKQLDLERVRRSMRQAVIFDGRNIYDPETMRRMGFNYRGVGRGYNNAKVNPLPSQADKLSA
jgi:UDPglucose 6-dehydrogenase